MAEQRAYLIICPGTHLEIKPGVVMRIVEDGKHIIFEPKKKEENDALHDQGQDRQGPLRVEGE